MKSVLRQFIRESLVNEAVGQDLFGIDQPADVKLASKSDDNVESKIEGYLEKKGWTVSGLFDRRHRHTRNEYWKKFKDFVWPDPKAAAAAAAQSRGSKVLKAIGIGLGVVAAGGGAAAAFKTIFGSSVTEGDKASSSISTFYSGVIDILEPPDRWAQELVKTDDGDAYDKTKFEAYYNDFAQDLGNATSYTELWRKFPKLADLKTSLGSFISNQATAAGLNAAKTDDLKKAYQSLAYSLVLDQMPLIIVGAAVSDAQSYEIMTGVDAQRDAEINAFLMNLERKMTAYQNVINATAVVDETQK